jgi:hypothetical protein
LDHHLILVEQSTSSSGVAGVSFADPARLSPFWCMALCPFGGRFRVLKEASEKPSGRAAVAETILEPEGEP